MTDKKKNIRDDPESNLENKKGNDKKWSEKKKSTRIRSEAIKKIIDFYKNKKQSD